MEPAVCVVMAGEALPPALAQRHRRIAPDTQLFNEYGPTEGTVWSTVHAVGPDDHGLHLGGGEHPVQVSAGLGHDHRGAEPRGEGTDPGG